MVTRRPSPSDTPDDTKKNTAIHYIGLALICVVVVVIIASLVA